MKIAIISDIHANASALKSVVDHIKKNGDVDEYWCLGDILGYGGQATETIDILMNLDKSLRIILGNHDAYWAGMIKGNIRKAAKDILLLNTFDLEQNKVQLNWINEICLSKKETRTISIGDISNQFNFVLVHATLADFYFSYTYPWTISENVELMFPENHNSIVQENNNFIFYGHSHIPSIKFKNTKGGDWENLLFEDYGIRNEINNNFITIINPGSVGQPRDGDFRSSYSILEFDDNEIFISFYRVEYPLKSFIINSRKRWYIHKKNENINFNDIQNEILFQTRNALGKRPLDDVNLSEEDIKLFDDILELRKSKKGD